MALHVMDTDYRLAKRIAERAGNAGADQKRAREARTSREGDAVEIGKPDASVAQYALGERHDAPHVIARGKFGHDAAVDRVHRHLRMQRMREQTAARVVDGKAGFVAGRFNAECEHGKMAGASTAGMPRYTVAAAATRQRPRICEFRGFLL